MFGRKIQRIVGQSLTIRYNYISKKALDDIEKAHGKTAFQRALMYTKQARHIAKEGFFSFKKDLEQYFKILMIEKVDNKTLTVEEQSIKKKIGQDMNRLKPIILINILPFSAPLLVFYILTYPTKVPSYFCLDQLFELHQKESIVKQLQAVEIFNKNPLQSSTFILATQSLEQLKLLSQLLFGHFEDGVVGINKYFKENPKSYLIHPHFSKHLVIRKIKEELKKDVLAHTQLQGLSAEELVLWKYKRVMSGQDRVVFTPITKNSQVLKATEQVSAEAKSQNIQISSENPHNRQNPTHRIHPQTVEHERHQHKSETRKKK